MLLPLLQLIAAPRSRYRPLVYVKALTDTTSEPKVRQHEISKNNGENCQFISIYRSREVCLPSASAVPQCIAGIFVLVFAFECFVSRRSTCVDPRSHGAGAAELGDERLQFAVRAAALVRSGRARAAPAGA